MIITLKGANFSASNIGQLDSWPIARDFGLGVNYDGPLSVKKNAALNATITISSDYELDGSVSVTMRGNQVTSGVTTSGNTITISIASVTGAVTIKVPTKSISGGEDSGSGDNVVTEVSFTNDDFEVGSINQAGVAIDANTRYRTKTTKTFNKDVLFTANALVNKTGPCRLRFFTSNGLIPPGSNDWITTSHTIPANTSFYLILAKPQDETVVANELSITVPSGATKLYINTLQAFKSNSYATIGSTTISGESFTNGLYHYGEKDAIVGTLTGSSKMAGYNEAITVSEGQTVVLKLFVSGTYGCVFTDDKGKIIKNYGGESFPSGEYSPLDYFTYEAQ